MRKCLQVSKHVKKAGNNTDCEQSFPSLSLPSVPIGMHTDPAPPGGAAGRTLLASPQSFGLYLTETKKP